MYYEERFAIKLDNLDEREANFHIEIKLQKRSNCTI